MLFEKRKGLRFAVGTAVIGGASYVLLGLLMPVLKMVTAWMSAGVLSLFGSSSVQGALVMFNSFTVQVIPLCVGDIEIAVLTGAILSTADRDWDDRIIGVVVAFAFVMIVNALRIAATMLAWEAWGLEALALVHSTLFRAVLVLTIVGFYAVWYLRDLVWEKLQLEQLLKER